MNITVGNNLRPTLGRSTAGYGRYASDCVDRSRVIHKCHRTMQQWMSFMTDNVAKVQHIFAHNGLPWGAIAP